MSTNCSIMLHTLILKLPGNTSILFIDENMFPVIVFFVILEGARPSAGMCGCNFEAAE